MADLSNVGPLQYAIFRGYPELYFFSLREKPNFGVCLIPGCGTVFLRRAAGRGHHRVRHTGLYVQLQVHGACQN